MRKLINILTIITFVIILSIWGLSGEKPRDWFFVMIMIHIILGKVGEVLEE